MMRRTISFLLEKQPQEEETEILETDDEQRISHMSAHRSWSLPAKEDPYESYGFVQVGEDPKDPSVYTLKRSKSTNCIDREESLYQVNRNLERQLRTLQTEIGKLKKKISVFEQSNDKWGVRYSKRVAFFANLILGVWMFWHKLLYFLHKRKRSIFTSVMMPAKNVDPDSVNRMILQGIRGALGSSSPFFLSALLLSRHTAWKRTLGSTLGYLWSLYLAIMSDFHPWTNYFNMLANLLYITAAWNNNPGTSAPTLREYNSRTSSSESNDEQDSI